MNFSLKLLLLAVTSALPAVVEAAVILDFANSDVSTVEAERYPDSDDGTGNARTGLTYQNLVTAANNPLGSFGIDLVISSTNYAVDNGTSGNQGAARNGLYDGTNNYGTQGPLGFVHQASYANTGTAGTDNGTGTYTYTFYRNDTNAELIIDSGHLSFYDIDGNPGASEYEEVVFKNFVGNTPSANFALSDNTALNQSVAGGNTTIAYEVPANPADAVNVPFPTDGTNLSEAERSVAFTMYFNGISSFQIDYNTYLFGDSGNRALLFNGEIAVVPEPSTFALLFSMLAFVSVLSRRRR